MDGILAFLKTISVEQTATAELLLRFIL